MFVAGYWGPRRESAEECADRIARVLREAAKIHPHFSHWYEKGATARVDEGSAVSSAPEVILKHLSPAETDYTSEPMPEVGYSLALWNGRDDDPVSLSINCGGFSERLKNSAVFRFRAFPLDQPPIPWDAFCELVKAVHRSFDTEIATFSGAKYVREAGGGVVSEVGGWITLRAGSEMTIAEDLREGLA